MPVSALRDAVARDFFVACNPHGMPQSVRAAVSHELKLIADLRDEQCFLTVYGIVRLAHSRDIRIIPAWLREPDSTRLRRGRQRVHRV